MSTDLIPHRKELRFQDLPRHYIAMLWSIEQYYGFAAVKVLRTPLFQVIMDVPEHIRFFGRDKADHTYKPPIRHQLFLQGIPEEYGTMLADLENYHGIAPERLLTPHILQDILTLHQQMTTQKNKLP